MSAIESFGQKGHLVPRTHRPCPKRGTLRLNRDLRSEATLKSLAVIFASYSGVLYFGPEGPELFVGVGWTLLTHAVDVFVHGIASPPYGLAGRQVG